MIGGRQDRGLKTDSCQVLMILFSKTGKAGSRVFLTLWKIEAHVPV
jgi:hypothetical protein